jgi:hypothetical protein
MHLRLTGRVFLTFPLDSDDRPARGALQMQPDRALRNTMDRRQNTVYSIALSFSYLSSFSHHPLPPNLIDSSPIRHLSCGRLVPDHSRIAQHKSFAFPGGRLLIYLPLYLLLLSPAFAHSLRQFHIPSKSTELDGFDSNSSIYKTAIRLTHRHTSSISPPKDTTYS